MDIDELKRKMREPRTKDIIRAAVRARNFSGEETLRQGMELIDFAIRIKRKYDENN
jgi:hypothetical protein